ncbi:MAG: tetratricopeptide repeat protein, partial [Deltaproteobacteria bacterium]|nr:tetratricopeptide repeat protein [Deltaproteobacteria bacterium]
MCRIITVLEKRNIVSLLAMIFIMCSFLSGCAHDKDNLENMFEQDTPGAETERMGDVYFDQGNLELALIQYNRYLRDNPDNARVFYKKG